MKIIAIAMQKGGVGKSTLARSLAVAGGGVGYNVLVLDMDAQQSMSQWAERRAEQLPAVKFLSEIELPKMLERAEDAGCDLVIIDTPPARSTEAPAAVEEADLVIVPCTPDIEAYEQLPRTARVARATGTAAAAVLTMVHPNSQTEEKIARKVFATIAFQWPRRSYTASKCIETPAGKESRRRKWNLIARRRRKYRSYGTGYVQNCRLAQMHMCTK